MGCFSWMYADIKRNMKINRNTKSFLLIPDEFHEKYGKCIIESCYRGHGIIGGYDVYELVLEWNRKYIDINNLTECNSKTKMLLEHYINGASDEEMKLLATKINYCRNNDWKRLLGIEISCYDSQNKSLKYPIKICSKYIDYDLCEFSKGDPNQGF